MIPRRLFGKLDDWLNPIVVKELRQAVRSRVVVVALMLFLLLQIALFGLHVLQIETAHSQNEEIFSAGRQVFRILQGALLGTCLLVPIYAGLRLGAERSDTNVDLLFISTLRPRAIVSGKLLAALVLVLLIFSACTPFMTFSYLLRGLDMPTIGLVLYIDFLVTLGAIQVALFLAVIPAPLAVRGVFILAGLGGLIYLFTGTLEWTGALIQSGLGTFPEPWMFWLPLLAETLVELGLAGLLFVWSVAILSPPSANRALPVRLYLLFFWLVTMCVAGYWSQKLNQLDRPEPGLNPYHPIGWWVVFSGVLFSLQLVLSINEREHWGPRVARSIPRRAWLRMPAFLLYSGSAGGVLFSLLILLLTFWGGILVLEHFGDNREGGESLVESLKLVMLVGLYTYCYCLSAVLIRAALMRNHLRPLGTWVLAVMLTGLGSILPYLLAYFFYPEALRYSAREQELWRATNPFASIDEAMLYHRTTSYPRLSGAGFREHSRFWARDIFDAPCLPFLAGWAAVVTLLGSLWVAGQAGRFQPLDRREEPVEVLPDAEEEAIAPSVTDVSKIS